MANTTFNGPVRSENGFKNIIKNSTTGALTNEMTLSTYTATIDIAASGTGHKEASVGIPSNFIPMGVAVTVVTAAANNVNLVDIGTDTDPDGFVDGLPTTAINAAGFKGFFGCNGVLGMSGFAAGQVAEATADEVEVTISGTAGAGGQISLKFFGISSDSPTA
tara:strand:+ start:32 stop:520 length:489 start_codon:yes stop_codon:yes gene_type:complete